MFLTVPGGVRTRRGKVFPEDVRMAGIFHCPASKTQSVLSVFKYLNVP